MLRVEGVILDRKQKLVLACFILGVIIITVIGYEFYEWIKDYLIGLGFIWLVICFSLWPIFVKYTNLYSYEILKMISGISFVPISVIFAMLILTMGNYNWKTPIVLLIMLSLPFAMYILGPSKTSDLLISKWDEDIYKKRKTAWKRKKQEEKTRKAKQKNKKEP